MDQKTVETIHQSALKLNPKAVIQILTMDNDSLKFVVPFVMSVCGPSQVIMNKYVYYKITIKI